MTQFLKENGNTSVAEREAELIALQSAFDEYIASSRELEEELDAELAKMRTFSVMLHFDSVFIRNSSVSFVLRVRLLDGYVCRRELQKRSWQNRMLQIWHCRRS